MYTLIVENKYGQQLELTHNPAYEISNIDGIDPPDAVMNTTHNAGFDGSVFNSSYMDNRTITITLCINSPAEENRINLYRYLKSKFPVKVMYRNEHRDVYINGYVQSLQIAFFNKKETVQIVIFCPLPCFNGAEDSVQEMSSIEPLFEFPFSIAEEGVPFSELVIGQEKSIINNGDVETGVLITVHAYGNVSTPKIYNVDTNEFMIFDVDMVEGDEITINTRQGEKSVRMNHEGTVTNIIGKMRYGSSWFLLKPGDNIFTTAADDGVENMLVTFTIINQYEGV